MAVFSSSSTESRTELLLKRADLADALEAAEGPQRQRRRVALALLAFGVMALTLGLTLDTAWLLYAAMAFQVPIFGFGLFLLAGQEVRRLRRELEAVDQELGDLHRGWRGRSLPYECSGSESESGESLSERPMDGEE